MKAHLGIVAAVALAAMFAAGCFRTESPYIAHGENGREPDGTAVCSEVSERLEAVIRTGYDYLSPRNFWQSGTNTSCRLWFNTDGGGMPCSAMEDIFNATMGQQLGGDSARVEAASAGGCRWVIWVDATRVPRSLR